MNLRLQLPGSFLAVLLSLLTIRAANIEPNLAPQIAAITNLIREPMAGTPERVTLANQVQGWSVLFQYTDWQLKSTPQSVELSARMEANAKALPEAERLKEMNRFDDFIQVWLFRAEQSPALDAKLKDFLVLTQRPNRYHRELAFLGQGRGYGWYAFMPVYDWTRLQRQLQLHGGEDALAAQVRGLSIEDR